MTRLHRPSLLMAAVAAGAVSISPGFAGASRVIAPGSGFSAPTDVRPLAAPRDQAETGGDTPAGEPPARGPLARDPLTPTRVDSVYAPW